MTPARRAALVGAAAVVAGALTLNRHLVGIFYDDGLYAGLAWALGHGLGYAHPNLPGAPAAVHYPPLYPLLLAPCFAVWGVPTAALVARGLNVAAAALAAGLVAWHSERALLLGPGAPRWLAPAVVAGAAVAIPWLTVLTVLLSEPLFALLVALAVVSADRPPRGLAPSVAAGLAGALAAAALLARSLGVAAGVGVVVAVYRRARGEGPRAAWGRTAWAALPLALAGGWWGAWVLAHRSGIDPLLASDYGSYFALLGGAGARALGGTTLDLGRPLGVLTLNWVPSRAIYYALGVPALVVGGYGLCRLCKTSAIGWTLVTYLAILACWPVPPDRFLWAVLPWLGLAWCAGAVGLWSRRSLRVPLALVASSLVLGYARYELRGFAGRWWDRTPADVSAQFAALLPALDSLPPDAVIATEREPLVWLYTRRRAVPFYVYALHGRAVLEPPPAVHRAYLEREGVTHLVADPPGGRASEELDRLRTAYPGWLVLERRWPDGRALYAVARDR